MQLCNVIESQIYKQTPINLRVFRIYFKCIAPQFKLDLKERK